MTELVRKGQTFSEKGCDKYEPEKIEPVTTN